MFGESVTLVVDPTLRREFWGWGMGFVFKNEDGTFGLLQDPESCRGYIQDRLYAEDHTDGGLRRGWFYNYGKMSKDKTYILMYQASPTRVEENLASLNEKEKRIGVEETKIYPVQNIPSSFIFVGDKVWQSNYWKLSIYTFYLKRLNYPDANPELYVPFRPFEEKFLSKVKNFTQETLKKSWGMASTIHDLTGFYSIATKKNEEMYKLLLED